MFGHRRATVISLPLLQAWIADAQFGGDLGARLAAFNPVLDGRLFEGSIVTFALGSRWRGHCQGRFSRLLFIHGHFLLARFRQGVHQTGLGPVARMDFAGAFQEGEGDEDDSVHSDHRQKGNGKSKNTSTFHSLIDRFMPPIRHQGQRLTCVAFSACGVAEHKEALHLKKPPRAFSEQLLHWMCKQADGHPQHEGSVPDFAVALLNREGLALKDIWPYRRERNPQNPTFHPPPTSALDLNQRHFPVECRMLKNPRDVERLKVHIRDGHAIGVAVPVFGDCFDGPLVIKTGNIRAPFPKEERTGGHAMILVGYNHDDLFPGGGYFIVRNSWGKGWGKRNVFGRGYGTIPFSYIAKHNHSAFIALPNETKGAAQSP